VRQSTRSGEASDAVVLHLRRTRLLVRVGARLQRFCMGRVPEVDPLIDQPFSDLAGDTMYGCPTRENLDALVLVCSVS
jgi:hypothetical protein